MTKDTTVTAPSTMKIRVTVGAKRFYCAEMQPTEAYCLFTSKVGPTDHFDWFMDYFVGLFTSSMVSYTEKLRSLNTSDMNSPVMHGAVPTQYGLTRSRHQCA